jgi:hypothetical protein
MVSSDERREVAKKIRAYVDAYGDGIEDAEMVLLGTVWGRDNRGDVVRPTSEAELLSMLADLIDRPTCTMTYRPEWSGDEIYPTAAYQCSNCGCVVNEGITEFCPECGARVIHDDN